MTAASEGGAPGIRAQLALQCFLEVAYDTIRYDGDDDDPPPLLFCLSAVALKNQQGGVEKANGDDGKPPGASDRIPEGELLLQVSAPPP